MDFMAGTAGPHDCAACRLHCLVRTLVRGVWLTLCGTVVGTRRMRCECVRFSFLRPRGVAARRRGGAGGLGQGAAQTLQRPARVGCSWALLLRALRWGGRNRKVRALERTGGTRVGVRPSYTIVNYARTPLHTLFSDTPRATQRIQLDIYLRQPADCGRSLPHPWPGFLRGRTAWPPPGLQLPSGQPHERHGACRIMPGIFSTVFRTNDMPFHPERLNKILTGFGDYSSALSASFLPSALQNVGARYHDTDRGMLDAMA